MGAQNLARVAEISGEIQKTLRGFFFFAWSAVRVSVLLIYRACRSVEMHSSMLCCLVLLAAILYLKPCRFLRQKAYSKTCQQQFALFEIHGLVSNYRFPWMPRIEVDTYPLFSRVFIFCCREWKALLERVWDLGKFVAEEVFSLF